jgi:hypothetical protein
METAKAQNWAAEPQGKEKIQAYNILLLFLSS